MARSLLIPQRTPLHQSIIELLRQRGNRLLGVKEIFERLEDSDVQRDEVDRAVEELVQYAATIGGRQSPEGANE